MAGSPATPRKSLKNIDRAVSVDSVLHQGKSTDCWCARALFFMEKRNFVCVQGLAKY